MDYLAVVFQERERENESPFPPALPLACPTLPGGARFEPGGSRGQQEERTRGGVNRCQVERFIRVENFPGRVAEFV